MLQLPKPTCLEPVLCNKRSHRNKKQMHRSEEQSLLAAVKTSASKKQRKTNKHTLEVEDEKSRRLLVAMQVLL